MIGRCVANRPYMYLPLKGDTNDYSVNAQNPSNTGVTTTTGQFGESNGAYEWDANTDCLAWSDTIGNTIGGYINNNATILFFANWDALMSSGETFSIFGNIGTSATNRAYMLGLIASTFLSKDNAYWLQYTTNGSTNTAIYSNDNVYTDSNWYQLAITFNNNTMKWLNDVTEKWSDTFSDVYTSVSGTQLRLGSRDGNTGTGNPQSFKGKMHNFRIYDVTLSDGQIKILNNEKGRIRV